MASQIAGLSIGKFDMQCRGIVVDAATALRGGLHAITVYGKDGYNGERGTEFFTNIGVTTQELIIRLCGVRLSERLGFIAEEGLFRRASRLSPSVTVTVDPDDGTGKMIQARKEGRASRPGETSVMLSILIGGKPVAGYICDIADYTIYARTPYSNRVVRIGAGGRAVPVASCPRARSLAQGTFLWHGRKGRQLVSELGEQLAAGDFREVRRSGPSFGLSAARVAAGEFVAMVRPGDSSVTPWDDGPVMAMCATGDIQAFWVQDGRLVPAAIKLDRPGPRKYDTFYVARRFVPEFLERAEALAA